jgi:hypothetical protein
MKPKEEIISNTLRDTLYQGTQSHLNRHLDLIVNKHTLIKV